MTNLTKRLSEQLVEHLERMEAAADFLNAMVEWGKGAFGPPDLDRRQFSANVEGLHKFLVDVIALVDPRGESSAAPSFSMKLSFILWRVERLVNLEKQMRSSVAALEEARPTKPVEGKVPASPPKMFDGDERTVMLGEAAHQGRTSLPADGRCPVCSGPIVESLGGWSCPACSYKSRNQGK